MKTVSSILGIPVGAEVVDYPDARAIYSNQFNAGLIPSVWGWDAARK